MKARIAYLPGDGIGVEVLQEARKVLEVIASEHNHKFEFVEADIGAIAIDRHKDPFPKVTEEVCLGSKAVLLGAVGHPKYDHLPPAERAERRDHQSKSAKQHKGRNKNLHDRSAEKRVEQHFQDRAQ